MMRYFKLFKGMQSGRLRRRRFSWIGGAAAVVLMGWLLVSALISDIPDYLDSRTWETTAAVRLPDTDANDIITYRYTVREREYTGSRAYFFQSILSDDKKSAVRRDYPFDTRFTIYYDPDDPAKSVIDRTLQGWDILFVALACTCLISLLSFGFVFSMGKRLLQREMRAGV